MSTNTASMRQGWRDIVFKLTSPITSFPSLRRDKKPDSVNDVLFRIAQIGASLRANGHRVRDWTNILVRQPDDVLINGARLTAVKCHVLEFERAIYRDMATMPNDSEAQNLLAALETEKRATQAATAKAKTLEAEVDELKWSMRQLDLEQEEASREHSSCVEAVWSFGSPEELWLENKDLKEKVAALEGLVNKETKDAAPIATADGAPTTKQLSMPDDTTSPVDIVVANLGKERRDALCLPEYDPNADHTYTGLDAQLEIRKRTNLIAINDYAQDEEETTKDKQWRRKPQGANHMLLKLKEIAMQYQDRGRRVPSWDNMLIRVADDTFGMAPRMKEIKAAIGNVTREYYQTLVDRAMNEWNRIRHPREPDGPKKHQPPDLRPEIARLRRALQTLEAEHAALQKHSDQQMLEKQELEAKIDNDKSSRHMHHNITMHVDYLRAEIAHMENRATDEVVKEGRRMMKRLQYFYKSVNEKNIRIAELEKSLAARPPARAVTEDNSLDSQDRDSDISAPEAVSGMEESEATPAWSSGDSSLRVMKPGEQAKLHEWHVFTVPDRLFEDVPPPGYVRRARAYSGCGRYARGSPRSDREDNLDGS